MKIKVGNIYKWINPKENEPPTGIYVWCATKITKITKERIECESWSYVNVFDIEDPPLLIHRPKDAFSGYSEDEDLEKMIEESYRHISKKELDFLLKKYKLMCIQ